MSEELSYEQAVEQVEQILARIESGQVGLEQTLADCERGMRLIARCRGVLSAAEKRIAELMVDAEGGLQAVGDDDDSDGELMGDDDEG